MENCSKRILTLSLCAAVFSTFANPIVFLHGWNSAGDLWNDMRKYVTAPVSEGGMGIAADDVMALSYYDSSSDADSLGFTIDTPIADVAKKAAERIVDFYLQRKQETGKDLPVDVVCHSMGGLVFRSIAAYEYLNNNSIVRRYITLGTPHYGQNASYSYEARQMCYGSDFLWEIGSLWHFDGKNWPSDSTLCIAGMTESVGIGEMSSGSYWDGLVHAWSASLGGDVPVRYVYRNHSSAMGFYTYAKDLCGVVDGYNDAVYNLVKDFIESGAVPESLTPTYDGANDGPLDEQGGRKMEKWAAYEQGRWSLFVQFINSNGSKPYQYNTSGYLNDFLVDGKAPDGLAIEYGSGFGYSGDTYPYLIGAAQVFGNITTNGTFGIRMLRPNESQKPDKNDTFYVADFSTLDRPILPAPGSCRFVRLYDTHDQSEVTVEADVAGGTVKVPVFWLVEQGLLQESEQENGTARANALATVRDNGYSGAGCYFFGVDPHDAADRCWIAAKGFAATNGVATVDYDRNEAAVEKEYVHLQHAATLPGGFEDMDDSKVTHEDTSLSVAADPNAKSGFYRPFVR